MKMHPDGTIEGSPEELAAFRHIDAAMTAQDVARAKVSQRKTKKAVAEKVVAKKVGTQTKSEDLLEIVKSLDSGDGVSAAELANRMGVETKDAYNKLYRLKTLGKLEVSGGRFRMVA